MQLLSLSISGFKSFAKPTRLDFAPGITAVVGPNGCGKSNIVDALRWVLGEQRSSVLRGSRMENVIFNGTATRKPSGMSEVKVLLDNSKGLLNLPASEVELARRLYRDGTSEYLLNGSECRLRDITDLLHDSGMGPNLYTILELKMVEDILREDGEGRRALFEEAAGIAKYKLRRRQALQKLKQTEDDLLRLADILSEVERQVTSLKRQAMRARKYAEYAGRLRELEIALVYRDYQRLQRELEPLAESLQQTSAQTETAKAAIRREEAQLLALRTKEIDIDREAAGLRKQLAAVAAEISALDAEEAGLKAKDQAARQIIERARRARQLLQDKSALLEVRRTELLRIKQDCHVELEASENAVVAATAKLKEAEALLNSAALRLQEHQQRTTELRNACNERRRECTQIELARAGFGSRRELLQQVIENAVAEQATVRNHAQTLIDQLQGCQAEIDPLLAREQALTEQIRHNGDLLHTLSERLRALTSLGEAVQSKIDLLATLEEKGPRAAAALRTLKAHSVPGLLEMLGDGVDVEEAYRPALQAALGPAAYYYITESVNAAFAAMDLLRHKDAGQTTFLPLSEFTAEPDGIPEPPADSLGTALSFLRHGAPNAALRHLLSRVVLVADWPQAQRLFGWARTNNCTLVTLDGQWIHGNGMLRGGSPDAGLAADIGLGHQKAELEKRLDVAHADRRHAADELRKLRSELAQMEQELIAVQRRQQDSLKRRTELREQHVKLETRLASQIENAQNAGEQIKELDGQTAASAEMLVVSVQRRDAADAQLRDAEESERTLADAVAERRRFAASSREQTFAAERARDALRHRLELLTADERRIDQSLDELTEETVAAEQLAEQAAGELVQIERRLQEIDALSIEKYRLRDANAEAVDRIDRQLDEIRNAVSEQDQRLSDLRSAHSGELEGGRRVELEVARLRGELNALVANVRNQLSLDITAADFAAQHTTALEIDTNPEAAQELKQKIERLGPINSLAVEEYAAESSRLDTMLRQRDDLLMAKGTLEETIARINETAQARFLHIFESVRAHFQRLFQEFFGAGEADLILSGSDLLEADITLWANPSGKRLKSLSLMSGGEKTMTAIALLFALYQVKPSPFCVFDEIDAPLDDSNIERFNRVVRMHSESTQFILVTHNRRTMEIVDNLYGVTMEEEGVSKLVSVRLLSSVV